MVGLRPMPALVSLRGGRTSAGARRSARMTRKPLWTRVSALLLMAALLGGCWGGPNVSPLEIVTVEPPPEFGPIGPPSGLVRLGRVRPTQLSISFCPYGEDTATP